MIIIKDDQERQDIITSLRKEMLKQYREYNASSNLLERIVETRSNAKDGAHSLQTSITYYPNSTREKLRVESIVPWDTSWES